jgi:hypothetical protein
LGYPFLSTPQAIANHEFRLRHLRINGRRRLSLAGHNGKKGCPKGIELPLVCETIISPSSNSDFTTNATRLPACKARVNYARLQGATT